MPTPSALEKMASATDQLAQQMNERLEEVERDIDEVLASQRRMLDGRNRGLETGDWLFDMFTNPQHPASSLWCKPAPGVNDELLADEIEYMIGLVGVEHVGVGWLGHDEGHPKVGHVPGFTNEPVPEGIESQTMFDHWSGFISILQQRGYRAQPLRRIYIPKSNRKGKRPLSIPTMLDRAMQALYKLSLAPVAETTADRNSYGFREGRACADAIQAALGIPPTRRSHSQDR